MPKRSDYARGCAGKVPYTRQTAIGKARRNSERDPVRWNAYRCTCGAWHIGHSPVDMGTKFGQELEEQRARRGRAVKRFDWRDEGDNVPSDDCGGIPRG